MAFKLIIKSKAVNKSKYINDSSAIYLSGVLNSIL